MPTPTVDPPEVDLPDKETYTYEDYRQLPEGTPYELIQGQLVMSPAPTPDHQQVARRLFRILDAHVVERGAGEVFFAPIDVRLAEDNVPQPDLLYIAADHTDRIGEQAIEGAPDLVAEILSPATAHRDLTEKKRLYETHGVREYWIVDPETKTVEVYRNTDEGFRQHARAVDEGRVASALLDDFAVDPGDLF